jgi:hypothetical protein
LLPVLFPRPSSEAPLLATIEQFSKTLIIKSLNKILFIIFTKTEVMKRIITILPILLLTISLFAQNERKVLVIGIDGTRGDAAIAANTPNLDALAANGISSYEAQTLPITNSGPGWTTILSGVWMDKHGVTSNAFIPNNIAEYPHFYEYVKGANPDLYTASIVHWSPINIFIAPDTYTDLEQDFDTDVAVKDAAVSLMSNESPDITFLHFDDVDGAGHSTGFSADNPTYISAIETVDALVGEVMTAVQSRWNYLNEDWLIVVCTDHGGEGTGHGCNSDNCQDIFYIASSDLLTPALLEKTIVEIPISAAAQLGGNDEYIEIPDASQHNFNGKDFTIEVRLKTNSWSSDAPIISNKDWASGFNAGFILSGNTDGSTWKFNVGDGTVFRMDMDGGTINDDEWHHIAVSLDRDGRSFTWQDGYVYEENFTGFANDSDTGFPLVIGQDGTLNYGDSFNGLISEVRIWDTNLRNITLNEWKCKDITSEHPNYGNLVGIWHMDEGTGTEVNDLSSFDESGFLSNGAIWSANNPDFICDDYSEVPDNTDIVPTMMDFMCLDMDDAWSFDGTSHASDVSCAEPTVICDDLSLTNATVIMADFYDDTIHLTINNSSDLFAAFPQMTVEFEDNPYITPTDTYIETVLSENGDTEFYPIINLFISQGIPNDTYVNGTATLYIAELELTCVFPFTVLLPGITVSVLEHLNPTIKIFPNISSDIISYDLGNINEEISLEIFSTQGKLIQNKVLKNKNGLIHINELNTGIYFLMMEDTEGEMIFREKIFKK